jgi:hypothetical protein
VLARVVLPHTHAALKHLTFHNHVVLFYGATFVLHCFVPYFAIPVQFQLSKMDLMAKPKLTPVDVVLYPPNVHVVGGQPHKLLDRKQLRDAASPQPVRERAREVRFLPSSCGACSLLLPPGNMLRRLHLPLYASPTLGLPVMHVPCPCMAIARSPFIPFPYLPLFLVCRAAPHQRRLSPTLGLLSF